MLSKEDNERSPAHAVREFMSGKPALGTAEPRLPLTQSRSLEAPVGKETNRRTLNVNEQELARYRRLLASEKVST